MTKSLFPTLIHFEALKYQGRNALNKDLLSDIKIIQKLDKNGQHWSRKNYPEGYTSYSSLTQLHRTHHPFSILKKNIDKHVKAFSKSIGWKLQGRKLEMTTCWVNVMSKLSHHSLHLHPLAALSGTYYVKTPAKGGSLKFEDPRLGLFMGAPPRDYFYSLTPKAGHLVLFESWLRHEVPANLDSESRISISFNYEWL